MPRITRGLFDGFIYHVLNRGNNKQKVFHKKGDYHFFIKVLQEAKKKYNVQIFAYCLMPNHFHLVLYPTPAKELSIFMQWLMTCHVRRYHRHYESSGHIWQGRFKSFIIQKDDYMLNVLRYVEANPIRGGLVELARNWEWSSHRERIGESSSLMLDKCPVELPDNWVTHVDEPLKDKELQILRHSVKRQSPYGNSNWRVKISEELGLNSTLRLRGRPRKTSKK